jgi:hypothetical protein
MFGATTWCNRVAKSSGNIWDGNFMGTPAGGNPPPAGGASDPALGNTAKGHLLIPRARKFARAALKRELGRRFTRGAKGRKTTCKRRSRAVVACSVKWRRSGHRYAGTVVVYRLSAQRRGYALRIKHWSRSSRRTNVIRRSGVL